MNIVCVGDCGVDRYLKSGTVLCGGITANFAIHARAAFPKTDFITLISALGNDDAAVIVQERIKNTGIACHFATLEGSSSVQYIEIEPDGEKNFIRYDEGVLRDYRLGEYDRKTVAESDLLVVPVFRQIHDFFASVMSIPGAGLRAVDFADFAEHPDLALLESHIESIDIGFFGLSVRDEEMIREIALLAARHGKLLIVTLGPGGSRAFRGDETFTCPASPVDAVVDTTGAGDAFAAGFLSRYCHGAGVGDALSYGAQLAARTIQRMGAN